MSTEGAVAGHEFEETALELLPGGGAEQDPDEWWEAVRRATRRLLARDLVPRERIVAVACTGQWSGTVAVDKAGNHLMNAVTWMDHRGAPYVQELMSGFPRVMGYGIAKLMRWVRLTGGAPTHSGKDSIAHILFIKNERPEVYAAAHRFLEPKDYLNLRLTGRTAASYDSIALHWVTDNRHLDRVTYHDRLLGAAGIAREKLPGLKAASDVLGPLRPEAAEELGLPAGIDVIVGSPDLQSAAVGSGAVRSYEAHLYVGTSSWVTCHVPFKKTDLLHNMASLPAAIPGRYFVANEQETAGACLTYLRDRMFFADDELATTAETEDVYAAFDMMAARVEPGSGGLIFMPWLYGERTPVDDSLLRGGFFNQSLDTGREHVVRAVLEGVAYNTRWLLGYVERFVKRRLDPLVMIGGGARSAPWCQIYADVLDRTIRQPTDPLLANVRGAAFLAAVAQGRLDFADIGDLVEIEATYEPDPGRRALYDRMYAEFLHLHRAARRVSARLNLGRAERADDGGEASG